MTLAEWTDKRNEHNALARKLAASDPALAILHHIVATNCRFLATGNAETVSRIMLHYEKNMRRLNEALAARQSPNS
jgi:hypothetical protein